MRAMFTMHSDPIGMNTLIYYRSRSHLSSDKTVACLLAHTLSLPGFILRWTGLSPQNTNHQPKKEKIEGNSVSA